MNPVFDANSPVGVLDSGIGGFSVARAVQQLLPAEQLIYFGDGAHIPYGNHPEDKIVAMARYMFSFLEQKQVKALLVACNTISCVIDRCADAVSCPTFNAVQAGANAVSRLDVEKVGVLHRVHPQLPVLSPAYSGPKPQKAGGAQLRLPRPGPAGGT